MVIVFGVMRIEFEPPAGSKVQNLPEACTVSTPTGASFRLTFSRNSDSEPAGPIQLGLFVLDGGQELPVFSSSITTAKDRVGFEMPRGILIVRATHADQLSRIVFVHAGLEPTWTGQVLGTMPG